MIICEMFTELIYYGESKMRISQGVEDKIEQIISFAEKQDLVIRYNRVMDILCDKDDTITEEMILHVLHVLEARGISILTEVDEDYGNAASDIDAFIPADVSIGQRPMNVYNLMERLDNEEINLTPEFQRNSNLWSVEQQSRLIESLMLKIPIPTFYFNAMDDDKWIVIDGLQRLSAFKNFLVGNEDEDGKKIKKKFTGLQYMTDFEGLTFDDLPRQYVRRIKETPIVAYTVEKGTPDAVVYNIFQRINTGGLKLEPQEIRQALYVGKATKLLEKLAEKEEFLQATQHAIATNRMADREYVNRFIAFTELNYTLEYRGNIDDYLRKALRKVNQYDEKDLLRVEKSFCKVMVYCKSIFGKYAFRKYNENWRRGPINKALFESWSLIFSELGDNELNILVERREKLLKRFQFELQSVDYMNALKSGDQYSVARRIEMTRNVVKEII